MSATVREELARAQLEQEDAANAALGAGKVPRNASATAGALSIAKIRVSGSIDLALTKLGNAETEITTQSEKVTDQLLALKGDEQMKGEVSALCTTNEETKTDALKEIAVIVVNVKRLKELVAAAQQLEDLVPIKKELPEAMKKITQGKIKEWNAAVRTSKTLAEQKKRKSGLLSAPVDGSAVVPAKYAGRHGIENIPEFGAGWGEALCGFKACTARPKGNEDIVAELNTLPAGKAAIKKVNEHLTSSQWGVLPVVADAKGKKFVKKLKSGIDPALFQSMALPSCDWSTRVFEIQFFGCRQYFVNVALGHFGCVECRLVLSGSETIFAVNHQHVPGNTLADKRGFLNTCADMDFAAVMARGFRMESDGSAVAIIPSGFFFVTLSQDVRGVRWSCAGDDSDRTRVQDMVQKMVSSIAEFSQPSSGYPAMLEFLDSA